MGSDKKTLSTRIKSVIRQINGSWISSDKKDHELIPELAIRNIPTSKIVYCYCIIDKRVIPVIRGQKCFLIDELPKNAEKIIVYTWDGNLVEIDTKEVIDTGFD